MSDDFPFATSEVRALFMQNLWRRSCGMPELDHLVTHKHKLEEAYRNWFPQAVSLMRNRMLMGIYRHGNFCDPNQPQYDRIGSAIQRLKMYQQTGNGEHLYDAMNLVGIESVLKSHPSYHFDAADDGYHTEVVGGT